MILIQLNINQFENVDFVEFSEDHTTQASTVLFKRTKHHKGSIYCLAWSPAGDLIATGSNDKTVKLMRFNPDTCNMEGSFEIMMTCIGIYR